jgi:hypothetical protein
MKETKCAEESKQRNRKNTHSRRKRKKRAAKANKLLFVPRVKKLKHFRS